MVKYSDSSLDNTFAALSDPIRRAILAKLSTGEKSVSDLARPFPISMPAVLKHLTYLQKAGLVTGAKQGRVRRFQLIAAPMQDAAEWIADYKQFWEQQFRQLEKYLDSQPKEESWQQKKQHKRQQSRLKGHSTRQEKGSTTRGRNSMK